MPKQFSDHGLSFLYPDNWVLEIDDGHGGPIDIVLQSPKSSLWSVKICGQDADMGQCIREMVVGLTDEIKDFEEADCEIEVEGHRLQGVEVNFFYLDLVVTARCLGLRRQEEYLLFLFQGEVRDFEVDWPVLMAITTSLLQGSTSDVKSTV